MRFLTNTLQKLRRASRNRRTGPAARNRAENRVGVERLEGRALLAGFVGIPNDPGFPGQWPLHNTGQTGGTVDADIDAPEAWSVTTGSTVTVVAILDGGVDYTHPDLHLNIWLNPGEIPANIAPSLTDTDSDGLITFRDLNASSNASYVTNLNGNAYIDGGDLLADPTWENGQDEDGNGRIDDLVGWDFHDNDNDPFPSLNDTHGTGISQRIAASGNNGVGTTGVMWTARLIPVRIQGASNADRIVENAAAGLDYAVAEGATISNNSWGDFTYSQVMFDAIDRARLAGHLFVASAGNDSTDTDLIPRYPASYNLDNVLAVMALDATDQKTPEGNWGLVNVDVGSPTDTGANSQATPHATGIAGLLRTLHPDWTYTQIKAQIMATVDPLPSLAGKCVTGGRVNAANALGVVQVTKFYVVDDAAANRTFEYGSGVGLARETYALAAGNAAPRGAASIAAGTTVWVVDADKKVYVYNPSGGLLGSWTAGSLASNATVEGMTTNGTDVWIVDAKQDKVFRYTNAAGLLSGSQNAASSFSLNSGNSNPKDIVTDGTHLWVVNDGTTDKVFKYTVAGALVGSWTISAAGGAPTGITLDPTSVAHLWIVDSAADRVYQYDNAASRTSGSLSASTNFVLAGGNTNPQGIADPPPQGSQPATGTSTFNGPGSVSSAFAPPAVASVSWSPLKKYTPERSDAHSLLRDEITESRESTDPDRQTFVPGQSKTSAGKQLSSALSQADQMTPSEITAGADLDVLFADWSTDPLQLLVSDAE